MPIRLFRTALPEWDSLTMPIKSALFPLLLYLSLFLAACSDAQTPAKQSTEALIVPERALKVYMTEQINLAGQDFSLWDNGGSCQLQANKGKTRLQTIELKPKPPCYFMKAPASERVQIYQRDKNNRVLAVLGTPLDATSPKRCGSELQGIILNAAGWARLSNLHHQDRKLCADQGLSNTDYERFAND